MVFFVSTLFLAALVFNAASTLGAPLRFPDTSSVARDVPIVAARASEPMARRYPRRVYREFYEKREPATVVKETSVTITKEITHDTPEDAAAYAKAHPGDVIKSSSTATSFTQTLNIPTATGSTSASAGPSSAAPTATDTPSSAASASATESVPTATPTGTSTASSSAATPSATGTDAGATTTGTPSPAGGAGTPASGDNKPAADGTTPPATGADGAQPTPTSSIGATPSASASSTPEGAPATPAGGAEGEVGSSSKVRPPGYNSRRYLPASGTALATALRRAFEESLKL